MIPKTEKKKTAKSLGINELVFDTAGARQVAVLSAEVWTPATLQSCV